MRFLYAVLLAIASPGVHVCTCVDKTFYVLPPFLNCYYDQDQQLSEDEELPLGVEAAINEDAFDLEDLEEDELIQDGAASQASLASSAFLSAIQEVKKSYWDKNSVKFLIIFSGSKEKLIFPDISKVLK